MTTLKTLSLKKPLSVIQQARLSQILGSSTKKGLIKKGDSHNKNKEGFIDKDKGKIAKKNSTESTPVQKKL